MILVEGKHLEGSNFCWVLENKTYKKKCLAKQLHTFKQLLTTNSLYKLTLQNEQLRYKQCK